MKIRRTSICLLLGVSASWAAPDSWRRLPLLSQGSVVSGVAVGDGRIAIGLSGGAVRVVDPDLRNPITVWDAVFGARGKIWGLAWHRGGLWIAAGRGLFRYDADRAALDRAQGSVPEAIRTGVRVLREQGDALWCASADRIVRVGDPGRGEFRQWTPPVADDPTAILDVSNRILVGTSSKGLLLLDLASGEWSRFGRSEGLSSDQVTGLEWIGGQIYISTPEGVDELDLSSRQIRPIVQNLMVAWMTQVNGTLMVTSPGGLFRVDPGTSDAVRIALPEGAQAEGDLGFGAGLLVVGGHSEILVREESSMLGREGLRLDPEGFRISLPESLPPGVRIQASFRIPEWPAAKIPMEVQSTESGRDLLLRLPQDIQGNVQVDLVAAKDGRTVEMRSLEGNGCRSKPVLDMDALPRAVRDSEIEISGKARGVGPLDLSLRPDSSRKMAMDTAGAFRARVRLRPGENRMELRLEDGIGNKVSRAVSVRRIDRAPEFGPPVRETVDAEFARIRVPFRGQGPVKVGIRPEGAARAVVFDSFVVVDARGLADGDNSWNLAIEDEVGNVATTAVHAFRKVRASSRMLDSALAAPRAADRREKPDSAAAPPVRTGSVPADPKVAAGPCAGDASIRVVRYRMRDGETIRKVAERFYGTRDLDVVLIRWNGFVDSTRWRRMPIGTPVDVPIWTDLDLAEVSPRSALASFPWDRIPNRGRRAR